MICYIAEIIPSNLIKKYVIPHQSEGIFPRFMFQYTMYKIKFWRPVNSYLPLILVHKPAPRSDTMEDVKVEDEDDDDLFKSARGLEPEPAKVRIAYKCEITKIPPY